MKKLFVLCTLLASTYIFSDHHHPKKWTLKGHGHWMKSCGKTGDYNVRVKGSHDERGLRLTQTFSHGEKSWSVSYMLLKKENGFFDVVMKGEKVGDGYCVKGHNSKTCHHHYTHKGHEVEVTAHMMGHRVHRMGSVKHDGKVMKFKDRLRMDHDHGDHRQQGQR